MLFRIPEEGWNDPCLSECELVYSLQRSGTPLAHLALAECVATGYGECGKGVDRLWRVGGRHMRRAAHWGLAEAQYQYGLLLQWRSRGCSEPGSRKRLSAAAGWYLHQACARGHPLARRDIVAKQ